MSTTYTIYADRRFDVDIVESSATYSLDIYDDGCEGPYKGFYGTVYGPQYMSAEQALDMAAGIIYAVWCMYQEKAEDLVRALAEDIPAEWNQITRKRNQSTGLNG